MPLVGLAGPFRLGQIRQHGGPARWAILADFHIQRNQSHLVKQFPRRSAELWVEDAYEDMYLDPIALLGAETPRLDMGLLYSAVLHRGGRQMEIEKYSACAPSATSVFVPSDTVRKSYRADAEADDSTPTIPVMEISQMTPEDIKQIVDALEQLDWVQWVKGQMLAKGPGGDVPPIAPEPDPEPPATEPAPPIEPTPEPAPEPPMPLTEGDEDTLPVKYSRLSSQVAQLKRELEVERGRIEEERSRRVNTERYAALADCRRTRLFDLDSEFELVRYGRMSDEQFSAHIDRITANYREIPIDLSIPTFDLPARLAATRPGGKAAKEKYSKEVSDKALAIAKAPGHVRRVPSVLRGGLEQVATGKL